MAGRTKYVVHKANIKDDDGTKIFHGEVAELGPELAKRYNKLGFLRPYMDEDDEDEFEDDDDFSDPNAPSAGL